MSDMGPETRTRVESEYRLHRWGDIRGHLRSARRGTVYVGGRTILRADLVGVQGNAERGLDGTEAAGHFQHGSAGPRHLQALGFQSPGHLGHGGVRGSESSVELLGGEETSILRAAGGIH